MTTLTPFHLTPLGLFHTLVSLVCVVAAFMALARHKEISPRTRLGQIYLGTLVITTLTGFPIFRHGKAGPPHVLGVLTLVVLMMAAFAETTRLFGRASAYVKTVCYSMTVFFIMIPTVTETLTRLPLGAPIVASPESPVFGPLYTALLLVFLIGAGLQVRTLRRRAG
ncbi:MAG TPA: hypothetical protein VKI41_20080 [Vicinamibacteria bacterium]|nr:hypothetical protein [Vicinamibacteria bacterium]